MRSLRLQGFDMTASQFAWVGLSHFLPQGGAEMDAGAAGENLCGARRAKSPFNWRDGTQHVLKAVDSCHIPGGEARAIRNDGNAVATMLVVMPHPVAAAMTLPVLDPAQLFTCPRQIRALSSGPPAHSAKLPAPRWVGRAPA